MKRRRLPPGVSFSASRAMGLTKVKRQLTDKTGVPLSRGGRQRKLGAAMGCCVVLAAPLAGLGVTTFIVVEMFR